MGKSSGDVYYRLSSERKDPKRLQQMFLDEGFEIHLMKVEGGRLFDAHAENSFAVIEPHMVRHFPSITEKSEGCGGDLELMLKRYTTNDSRLREIINAEYDVRKFDRKWAAAGVVLGAAYGLGHFLLRYLNAPPETLAFHLLSIPFVFSGTLYAGLIADDKLFSRKNRPWKEEEVVIPGIYGIKNPPAGQSAQQAGCASQQPL